MSEKNYESWNMGMDFYKILADLKRSYIMADSGGDYSESLNIIGIELDLIASLIYKKEEKTITAIRRQINQILLANIKNKKILRINIFRIRQAVWDLEGRNGINYPIYNNVNKSNIPAYILNNNQQ